MYIRHNRPISKTRGNHMLLKITRRRRAAAVTALMAGSVLGAGVPALVLSGSHDSAQAAVAAIRLQVTAIPGVTGSVNVTFAKFGGSTYDATPAPASGGNTKAIVNAIPPTITLSAPFASSQVAYKDMIAWEQAVRAGNPAGRADAM